MTKRRDKPGKEPGKGGIDTEMLRLFMLGGTEMKDESRPQKKAVEVDLHFDESTGAGNSYSDGEKLSLQLKHLEQQMDKAIANGSVKLSVIHGKGAGKLKNAVHDFLKKHPQVRSFRIINDPKHGGGATEVFFK